MQTVASLNKPTERKKMKRETIQIYRGVGDCFWSFCVNHWLIAHFSYNVDVPLLMKNAFDEERGKQ